MHDEEEYHRVSIIHKDTMHDKEVLPNVQDVPNLQGSSSEFQVHLMSVEVREM